MHFTETKILKRKIRDIIIPERALGHNDRDHDPASASASVGVDRDGTMKGLEISQRQQDGRQSADTGTGTGTGTEMGKKDMQKCEDCA